MRTQGGPPPRRLGVAVGLAALCAWGAPAHALDLDLAKWKRIAFDFEVEYQRSEWVPTRIEGADYDTTGLDILAVDLNLSHRLSGWWILPRLPHFRWEFTPGSSSFQSELLSLQSESFAKSEAYTRLLGIAPVLRLPYIEHAFDGVYSTLGVEFEAFAFGSDVTVHESKTYVDLDGNESVLAPGDSITGNTVFRKFWAGFDVLTHVESRTLQQSFAIGGFLLYYQKPYAITIEGVQDPSRILDGEFEAYGGGLHWNLRSRVDGGRDDENGTLLDVGLGMDVGRGDIAFGDGTSVADRLPENRGVIYLGLNADLGIEVTVAKYVTLDLEAAYRGHYFVTSYEENGQIVAFANAAEDDINADHVVFFRAGLHLAF